MTYHKPTKVEQKMFEKYLTAPRLSTQIGLPESTIRFIMDNGISRTSVEKAHKIAKKLGCSIEDLID